MEPKSILVIDDELDILELVSYNLKKEGFKLSTAADGKEGLQKIRKGSFDLVILDLMLPGIQGVDVCRELRSNPGTEDLPVIMLTARTDTVDKVRGLDIGADDYMTKPFSPKELIARVRALLRRSDRAAGNGKMIRLGDLSINAENYSVTRRGTDPSQFDRVRTPAVSGREKRQGLQPGPAAGCNLEG